MTGERIAGWLCCAWLGAAPLPQVVAQPGAPIATLPWGGGGELTETDPRTSEGNPYEEFQVQLRSGQRYRATVDAQSADTVLTIFGLGAPDETLASDDDSGEGVNPRATFQPDRDGTFVVRVASFTPDQIGTFRLSIERLNPLPAPVERPTRSQQISRTWRIFEGSLAATDPETEGRHFDDYQVRLSRGQEIFIEVESSIDTMVAVLPAGDRNAEPSASDDDNGSGLNPMLVFEAADGGNYIIRVTTFGEGETGPYVLRLSP